MGNKKVKNLKFSYSGRSITAIWDFDTGKYKSLDRYDVYWNYWNPSSKVWSGWNKTKTNGNVKNNSITLGDAYDRAKVKVKPFQKKNHGKNKKWTGGATEATTKVIGTKKAVPENPTTPSVEITGTKLIAFIENYKTDGATIRFYIVKNNSSETYVDGKVVYSKAEIEYKVEPGCRYKVRCRAYKGSIWSDEYSTYSNEMPTGPGKVPGVPECNAIAVDEEENVMRVSLKWQKAPCVGDDAEKDSYEIEYTKKEEYFDRSADDVTSTESKNIDECIAYITISDAATYFFRVRGVNASGKGGWSEIAKVTVGMKPEAPTTWSYSTSVASGDDVILNWTHNSADGSKQRVAEIEALLVTAENQETEPETIPIDPIEDDTQYYVLSTAGMTDGSKILWRVRTQGVYAEFSEWSIQRTVYIYEMPTATISLELQPLVDPKRDDETQEEYEERANAESVGSEAAGKITSYPLKGSISTGPDTQSILSLDFVITANESYETEDDTGMRHYVGKGDRVYILHVDNAESNEITFELDPGDVNFETGVEYVASVIASMNSGLEAYDKVIFKVVYDDDPFDPDAEVQIDPDTYSAIIRPYCEDEFGAELRGGATLRVYRRNYDGTFTRIVSNEDEPEDLPVGAGRTLTDPHPALDYARYRVVAKSEKTGQVFYYDVPGEPINSTSIVINWMDEWSELDNTQDEAIEDLPTTYVGSLLVLPYNVDVSENNAMDVGLIEYIGREHPVSYYGTQKGYSASWKCEIPKTDEETFSAVRRLARYAGDVYVREPSGAGYWASIKVSYSVDHNKPNIPITFDITRVEGGM